MSAMDSHDGRINSGLAGLPAETDVLVIGLGVTGAGVALDAASRGLSVVAVEAEDVAFGTSRWSSKLVHGGLRYLANAQFGVAHESAVERGLLMERIAPHLVHTMPMLLPLTPAVGRPNAWLSRSAFLAGDLLRLGARTRRDTLPRPRKISRTETLALAGAAKRQGLRGGLLSWDGQLEDDARLVVGIARTAAAHGAHVHTKVRVVEATGTSAVLSDGTTTRTITAKAVISATGVWADQLVPEIKLKPSRGTHLVVRKEALPQVRSAITAPVPGSTSRFVFALPQADGLFYIGLTDDEVDEVEDVPSVPDADVDFLLATINTALEKPLTRDDVVGSYAGLRPLLDAGGHTSDISRRHAVLTSTTGVITVVGGKLTTYRRMAEDAVDAAISRAGIIATPCRTRDLPLLGAASREHLDALPGHPRLVRRFGLEADLVLENARTVTGLPDDELLDGPVTLAELIFGVTHEGARTVDDLLDRRVRVGLVPEDRARLVPLAERALELSVDAFDQP